jgi:transglutaminase-like putative cysteine protease
MIPRPSQLFRACAQNGYDGAFGNPPTAFSAQRKPRPGRRPRLFSWFYPGESEYAMYIKVGYELIYDCPQPTPVLLMLNIHYSHAYEIVTPDHLVVSPVVEVTAYRDGFGNWCRRLEMPTGRTKISTSAVVRSTGIADPVVPGARQHPISQLPEDTLVYLLPSRYCETELLNQIAGERFGNTPDGWARVQAICDFVHHHIHFDYNQARATRTAMEAYNERVGVCRDYAHLAITLCRCMNIPARYCTGYLGDIGMPPPYGPMDFASWFEAYLGGHWYVFDARNNMPRIGRVLIARGRDAVDVAISTTFGPNTLAGFTVVCDEVAGPN